MIKALSFTATVMDHNAFKLLKLNYGFPTKCFLPRNGTYDQFTRTGSVRNPIDAEFRYDEMPDFNGDVVYTNLQDLKRVEGNVILMDSLALSITAYTLDPKIVSNTKLVVDYYQSQYTLKVDKVHVIQSPRKKDHGKKGAVRILICSALM